jgi:hypothetical protein
MKKDELFDIFRKYACKEFEDIPKNDDDIDYEFSEDFENRMSILFERLYSSNKLNKTGSSNRKKTIVILIAAVIIILTGMLSVSAVRQPIVNFVVEKYEDFIDFLFQGDVSNKIEYVYSFNPVPENFVETNKSSNDNTVRVEYINSSTGDEIILEQRITEGTQGSWDAQNGNTTTVMLNNTLIYFYKYNTAPIYLARWINDTYSFTLTYYGNITEKELIELVKSIV